MLEVVPIEDVNLHIQQGYLASSVRIRGAQHQGSPATKVTCYPEDERKKYTMVFQGSRVWETGIRPFFVMYVLKGNRHINIERHPSGELVSP